MKEKKVWFKNSKGRKLCGKLYVPEGRGSFPAVVHVHGFGGGAHQDRIKHINTELAKTGFVALGFDMYDKPNSLSEPKIENMTVTQQLDATKCAIDFIEKLKYVDEKRLGLTGHSLGGMTVLLYTPTDKRVKALVPQSPVSDFKKMTLRFCETEGLDLGEWEKNGIRTIEKSWGSFRLKYKHYKEGSKYDVYSSAEEIDIPTLVIHGDMDDAVLFDQSKELIKHIKNGKLKIIPGADHCYYDNNTLPVATSLIVNWFKRYLK